MSFLITSSLPQQPNSLQQTYNNNNNNNNINNISSLSSPSSPPPADTNCCSHHITDPLGQQTDEFNKSDYKNLCNTVDAIFDEYDQNSQGVLTFTDLIIFFKECYHMRYHQENIANDDNKKKKKIIISQSYFINNSSSSQLSQQQQTKDNQPHSQSQSKTKIITLADIDYMFLLVKDFMYINPSYKKNRPSTEHQTYEEWMDIKLDKMDVFWFLKEFVTLRKPISDLKIQKAIQETKLYRKKLQQLQREKQIKNIFSQPTTTTTKKGTGGGLGLSKFFTGKQQNNNQESNYQNQGYWDEIRVIECNKYSQFCHDQTQQQYHLGQSGFPTKRVYKNRNYQQDNRKERMQQAEALFQKAMDLLSKNKIVESNESRINQHQNPFNNLFSFQQQLSSVSGFPNQLSSNEMVQAVVVFATEDYFQKSLVIQKSLYPDEDSIQLAPTYKTIAMAYESINQFSLALKYSMQYLKIVQKVTKHDSTQTQEALEKNVYLARNCSEKLDIQIECLQKLAKIRKVVAQKQSGYEELIEYANVLTCLGQAQEKRMRNMKQKQKQKQMQRQIDDQKFNTTNQQLKQAEFFYKLAIDKLTKQVSSLSKQSKNKQIQQIQQKISQLYTFFN